MKYLTEGLIIGVSTLGGLVTGATVLQPQTAPNAAAILERDIDAITLEKREANGANCWKYADAGQSYWRISTWGSWDQDWGGGLLDNLRGQCGQVTNWGFGFEQGVPPTNGFATFELEFDRYFGNCVRQAILLASNGDSAGGGAISSATCWDSNKWW